MPSASRLKPTRPSRLLTRRVALNARATPRTPASTSRRTSERSPRASPASVRPKLLTSGAPAGSLQLCRLKTVPVPVAKAKSGDRRIAAVMRRRRRWRARAHATRHTPAPVPPKLVRARERSCQDFVAHPGDCRDRGRVPEVERRHERRGTSRCCGRFRGKRSRRCGGGILEGEGGGDGAGDRCAGGEADSGSRTDAGQAVLRTMNTHGGD
jgi:hypothetical protein